MVKIHFPTELPKRQKVYEEMISEGHKFFILDSIAFCCSIYMIALRIHWESNITAKFHGLPT